MEYNIIKNVMFYGKLNILKFVMQNSLQNLKKE